MSRDVQERGSPLGPGTGDAKRWIRQYLRVEGAPATARAALPWVCSGLAALVAVSGGLLGPTPAEDDGGVAIAGAAGASLRFPDGERTEVEPDDVDRHAVPAEPPRLVGPEAPWERYGDFRGPPDARLGLYALNFRETIRVAPFGPDGHPDPIAFGQIAHVMRCRRSGRERPVDPRLVVLLSDLYARFRETPLQLISGFRVPGAGHTRPTSYHVQGMAADVRMPGVGPGRLYGIAEAFGAGGVGLYPKRGERFVHVDVRDEPYRWRERWNGRNAPRRVRHREAHAERMARYPLPRF